MTQMQWYVLDQSKTPPGVLGPFGRAAIERMIWQSELTAATLVARVGAQDWAPAGEDSERRSMIHGGATVGVPAPPTSLDDLATGEGSTLPEGPVTVNAAFSLGWATFAKGYGHLLLCVLVLGLCYLPTPVFAFIGLMMEEQGKWNGDRSLVDLGRSLTIGSNCLSWLIWPVFAPALTWPGVRLIRGEARISDVFAGFRRFFGILGTGMLWGLAIAGGYVGITIIAFLGTAIVQAVDRSNETAALILGIVLFLFGIVLVVIGVSALIRAIVAMTFSAVLLVDPRETVRAGSPVMSLAWRMANVNKGRPTVVVILAGLLAGLSILLACVGYIFLGAPLYIAVTGAAYELARLEVAKDRVRMA